MGHNEAQTTTVDYQDQNRAGECVLSRSDPNFTGTNWTSLTLGGEAAVVVVGGTVGAPRALHPLSARALSGPIITHPARHGAVDVTSTRKTAQGVTPLQRVVTTATGVTETTFHMLLKVEERG